MKSDEKNKTKEKTKRDRMISVKPEKLKEIRLYYGSEIRDVPESVISAEKLIKFESGEDFPTYAELSRLADYYNRPMFFFFMERSDDDFSPIPVSFRSTRDYSGADPKKMQELKETAGHLLMNVSELFEEDMRSGKKMSFYGKLAEDKIRTEQEFIDWLRKELDFPLEKQKSMKNTSAETLEYIRSRLYDLGIYVFKDAFKDIPETVSGLCVYDENFPVILLNNKNTFNRQLFTLFHELCHLFSRRSEINIDSFDDDLSDENDSADDRSHKESE